MGSVEPRKLLGRAGGHGQPFGVLCFGRSVLEGQRVEEGNPVKVELAQAVSGRGLGGSRSERDYCS